VQQAIERYDRDGLEAAVAHYNSPESIGDNEVFLLLLDPENRVLVHPLQPQLIGQDFAEGVNAKGVRVGELVVEAATAEGAWIQFEAALADTRGSGFSQRHMLSVRHDNLIFIAGFFASE